MSTPKQDFTEKLDWFNDDTAADLDLIYVVDYDDKRKKYTPKKKKLNSLVPAREQVFLQIGEKVSFDAEKVYSTATNPYTLDIVLDQTNAVLGIVQKMYHLAGGLPPSITGVADVQRMGTTTYSAGVLNVIYFEWTETDRIEYWITQEG